jgi:hypothetical protein
MGIAPSLWWDFQTIKSDRDGKTSEMLYLDLWMGLCQEMWVLAEPSCPKSFPITMLQLRFYLTWHLQIYDIFAIFKSVNQTRADTSFQLNNFPEIP